MYQVGELIIYGSSGVCRVVAITDIQPPDTENKTPHYILQPLYQKCRITVPINKIRVLVRPVISKRVAETLIEGIPDLRVGVYHNRMPSQLSEYYDTYLKTYDCAKLIELTLSIRAKKRLWEGQKRKLGTLDETFMRRAEELLYGELSVALGLPREEVQASVRARLDLAQEAMPAPTAAIAVGTGLPAPVIGVAPQPAHAAPQPMPIPVAVPVGASQPSA